MWPGARSSTILSWNYSLDCLLNWKHTDFRLPWINYRKNHFPEAVNFYLIDWKKQVSCCIYPDVYSFTFFSDLSFHLWPFLPPHSTCFWKDQFCFLAMCSILKNQLLWDSVFFSIWKHCREWLTQCLTTREPLLTSSFFLAPSSNFYCCPNFHFLPSFFYLPWTWLEEGIGSLNIFPEAGFLGAPQSTLQHVNSLPLKLWLSHSCLYFSLSMCEVVWLIALVTCSQ